MAHKKNHKKKPPPKGSKPPRITTAELYRLGPEVANIKARTDPKQWKQIVKNAHARGFSVAGALSGQPDPLKERTRGSLVKEATGTVKTAFAPAEAEYTQQESKIRALDAKRQTDNTHFQTWLANEQSKLNAQAATADSELERRQADIQTQTQQGYQAAQAEATKRAGATAGNVSDPSQSKSLDFSAAATKANEMVANQRTQSASMMGSAQTRAQGNASVVLATGAQLEQRRQSETGAALSDLRGERKTLALKQAAAAAEEIQRLFGVEIEKADSNRNYLAAADKLGIEGAKVKLAGEKAASDDDFRRDKLSQDRRIANAKVTVDYAKIVASKGQKAADRALKRELDRAKAGRDAAKDGKKDAKDGRGVKVTAGEKSASAKVYNRLSAFQADIERLRKKGFKGTLRDQIVGKGASKAEYELALDLAYNNKLSAINRRRARSLGLIIPPEWR